MRKLNSFLSVLFLLFAAFSVSAQTTVTINCTGATNGANPNSGYVTYGGSKTYGNVLWNNSVSACSGSGCRAAWARFNLSGNIPSNATIISASVEFEVYDKTFNNQEANRLRVFTGNPGTGSGSISGTNLYDLITSTSSANNHGSFGNIPSE